jgi:hypothetical protein
MWMGNRNTLMERLAAYLIGLAFLFQGACNSSSSGCTDPHANNFDTTATYNDGSCTYEPVWVTPVKSVELTERLNEASGLIAWEGDLWTHVDNSDTRLYRLDPSTGETIGEYLLDGITNKDWEEISQDSDYLYLGDFGNNASGNRTDLHILRIEKGSLLAGSPSIDTIWFTYSDQHNFDDTAPNQTEFDCEAFIVFGNSIYLFTKQWITGNTTLYSLPKIPGSHIAGKISTFHVDGLITGAVGTESAGQVVLCGYTGLLQPFLCILNDYRENDFLSGNKRVVNLNLPFHQVEGIAKGNNYEYYLINEAFTLPSRDEVRPKLHLLDLALFF